MPRATLPNGVAPGVAANAGAPPAPADADGVAMGVSSQRERFLVPSPPGVAEAPPGVASHLLLDGRDCSADGVSSQRLRDERDTDDDEPSPADGVASHREATDDEFAAESPAG